MSYDFQPGSRPRPNRKPGVIVLLAGGVVLLVAVLLVALRSGSTLLSALGGDVHTAPFHQTLHLEGNTYLVYELVGHESGVFHLTFTSARDPQLGPADVTVTDSRGAVIATGAPSFDQTVTLNGAIYAGVATFDVSETGDYSVMVSGPLGVEFFVAPSIGSVLRRAVPGLLVGFPGLVAVFVGLLMVVLAPRRTSPAPVGSLPPAGWYPDPRQPGSTRWWDGGRWAP